MREKRGRFFSRPLLYLYYTAFGVVCQVKSLFSSAGAARFSARGKVFEADHVVTLASPLPLEHLYYSRSPVVCQVKILCQEERALLRYLYLLRTR